MTHAVENIKKTVDKGVEQIKLDQTKIWTLSREIEKLKKEVSLYSVYLQSQTNDIQLYEKNISSHEIFHNAYNEETNNFNKVNFLFQLKYFENILKTVDDKDELLKVYDLFRNEMNIVFSENDSNINNLNKVVFKHESLNKDLCDKTKKYEEEVNKSKFCIHCHQYFVSKVNDDKSCLYHPGNLKYYSCRACGADEYYTCCMKCSNCIKGCKQTKHVAEY